MKGQTPAAHSAQAGEGGEAPGTGNEVITACNGRIRYAPDMLCGVFRGEVVYFCLPACKQDFDENPYTSCLVARLESRIKLE